MRRGLGVIAAHGMAAWLALWHAFVPADPPAAPPRALTDPAPAGAARSEMVAVLAAIALAHLSVENEGVP